MNNVKLLHIKCCFFKFFSSPVALKNKKNCCPQEKVEMTPLRERERERELYIDTYIRERIVRLEDGREQFFDIHYF